MKDQKPPKYSCTKFIPDELIEKICVQLPAKCIGQFRSVSKSWNSLLSEPHFITDHNERIRKFPNEDEQQSLLLLSEKSVFRTQLKIANADQVFDEMTASATKLIFTANERPFQRDIDCVDWVNRMCTCDGLVLVQDNWNELFLINPTIKQVKQLPDGDFDSIDLTTVFGLGFDSAEEDYKVVSISYDEDAPPFDEDLENNDHLVVCVYSLKNDKWDKAPNPDSVVRFQMPGVFFNGRIHWLARRMFNGPCVIMAFDLAKQKFEEVVVAPSSIETAYSDPYSLVGLVALGDCLCICSPCPYSSHPDSDVWVMKEYGVQESWTIFATIHTGGPMLQLKCLSGKEQLVLMKLECCFLHRLMVYNREDATLKDIVVQGISSKYKVGVNYLESLVSPYYNN